MADVIVVDVSAATTVKVGHIFVSVVVVTIVVEIVTISFFYTHTSTRRN